MGIFVFIFCTGRWVDVEQEDIDETKGIRNEYYYTYY